MSKERAAALAVLQKSLKDGDADAPIEAICTLIGDGLGSLARIAGALEDGNKASATMVSGIEPAELKEWQPLLSPEMAARLVAALEKLAGIPAQG